MSKCSKPSISIHLLCTYLYRFTKSISSLNFSDLDNDKWACNWVWRKYNKKKECLIALSSHRIYKKMSCFLIHHSRMFNSFVLTGYWLLQFTSYLRAVPYGYPVHIIIKRIAYRTYVRCQLVKLAARYLAMILLLLSFYFIREKKKIWK
jgi:hypothetical protein